MDPDVRVEFGPSVSGLSELGVGLSPVELDLNAGELASRDLEGLARALRALAFDSKTARVYDAVVHVLPDAAKVLDHATKRTKV